MASAKADLLPRFSISFLGQGFISIDSASDLKGWGSLLSAGIQLPIFTNGRIEDEEADILAPAVAAARAGEMIRNNARLIQPHRSC